MQNSDRTPPKTQTDDFASETSYAARVVELYEEPHEEEQIPIVIMAPKGVPYSALHD